MVRNMTDFCKSFVYENDSATVSDLAELYNKGIFSYDIKIILGGCYNGARHSDYPMPNKNNEVNYQWKSLSVRNRRLPPSQSGNKCCYQTE